MAAADHLERPLPSPAAAGRVRGGGRQPPLQPTALGAAAMGLGQVARWQRSSAAGEQRDWGEQGPEVELGPGRCCSCTGSRSPQGGGTGDALLGPGSESGSGAALGTSQRGSHCCHRRGCRVPVPRVEALLGAAQGRVLRSTLHLGDRLA